MSGGTGDDQFVSPPDGSYDRIYYGDGSDFVEAGYGDYVAPDREKLNRYQHKRRRANRARAGAPKNPGRSVAPFAARDYAGKRRPSSERV